MLKELFYTRKLDTLQAALSNEQLSFNELAHKPASYAYSIHRLV